MSDRDPFSQEPDPTEVFPPFRSEPQPPPTGSDLPPIGADRDPDPTRVMPPSDPYNAPTAAMPPAGGPFEPGPPYGGGPTGPGGPGGPDEPEFEPEPDPWYRQPGPIAALIAGVAALVLALIALLVWTSGDDDDTTDDTLPAVPSTTSTTVAPSSTESTTTTTEPEATTSSSTSTTTSTTTTSTTTTTTTTTLAPTTTQAPTTTAPPATTTTVPVITVPPGANVLQIIQGNEDFSELARGLECTGLDSELEEEGPLTLLAPSNQAFGEFRLATGVADICAAPDQLEPILLFHIIDADLTADQIEGESELTTRGGEVTVNDDGTIGSTDAAIVVPDVQGANGLIQAVDAVIQS